MSIIKCIYFLIDDLSQVGHAKPGVADGRGIDVDSDIRSFPGKQVFLKTRWYMKNKYIFTSFKNLVDVVV